MIDIKEVEKLAKLARIELTAEEKKLFQKEIAAILDYVSELKEISTAKIAEGKIILAELTKNNRNGLREDVNPHASGLYTKTLLSEAPKTEKGFVKVKKIFE